MNGSAWRSGWGPRCGFVESRDYAMRAPESSDLDLEFRMRESCEEI